MVEDRGINTNRRLFDFTLKLFACYRIQSDERELTFPFRSLDKALALGLEKTQLDYVCTGKNIPESVQEISTILRFTQGTTGIRCIELEEIISYAHQVSASHPQPPTFNYERVFMEKGQAYRTLKRYGTDEEFLQLARNIWDNVEKVKKGYILPKPLIIGKRIERR
ncbi:MAG: hypothetical protein KJ598_02970 [Nanoarchaeota archaeon]|nr:hypothetical protein [Nanoarchaeota archaeon]MBU1644090.1 hypothetical protein [Nanoarchaeota archaeon]